jgi:hypothetical protein
MTESREELERLARRLCEAAGWEFEGVDASNEQNLLWKVNPSGFILMMKRASWLPLARIVAERDRLREAIGRVEALADWWTEEMHRAKDQRQLAIAPEEILIEQRIDQLRAALEGK